MENSKVYAMKWGTIYPLLVQKVQRKNRTQEEADAVISWLTGYDPETIHQLAASDINYEQFFANAMLNPNRLKITGSICGVRLETIEEPLMKEIRYLDKLIDELAKGKPLEKIYRN